LPDFAEPDFVFTSWAEVIAMPFNAKTGFDKNVAEAKTEVAVGEVDTAHAACS